MPLSSRLVLHGWNFCCRNYLNDIHMMDVAVQYPPETIAAACIYLAARTLKVTMCTLIDSSVHLSWVMARVLLFWHGLLVVQLYSVLSL